MASFNQAVNIPEPQDSIMVIKIKHSARGLTDAPQANADDPQIDRNDPQIDAPADPPRMNQLDLEYLFQLIEKSYLKINETLDRIEKRFNNREIE